VKQFSFLTFIMKCRWNWKKTRYVVSLWQSICVQSCKISCFHVCYHPSPFAHFLFNLQ